jgi:hypothetical protein
MVRAGPVAADTQDPGTTDYRAASALGLGGAYAGFAAWAWVAWYRDRPRLPDWTYGGDGGFAVNTYAGGADKLGHAWATMVLSRLGSELLEAGGWSDTAATAIASGLCLGAFVMVEVNDGYFTEFSPLDLGADVAGVAAASAFRHLPGLDDWVDFRVQWFPSRAFRRRPGANFAEDYSGQTYLLALKPSALAPVREQRALVALGFINPVVGFESRNYVPEPAEGQRVEHRQTVFWGMTFDVQAVIDAALRDSTSSAGRVTHAIGGTVFEYANLPFSTLPIVRGSRRRSFVNTAEVGP